MSKPDFLYCPHCDTHWETREAFLADPCLNIRGYTTRFEKLVHGLFFFTHKISSCYAEIAGGAFDYVDMELTRGGVFAVVPHTEIVNGNGSRSRQMVR